MGILLFFGIGFVLFFPLPLFVRRFGKFMPADAGTALVRSFHIPRFAKASNAVRKALRRRLWFRLLRACFKWGFIGGILLCGLLYFGYSPFLFVFFMLSALMAGVDERLHLLPDVLTVPMLILGFFTATMGLSGLSPLESAVGALFGYLMPMIASALMTPFRPQSLGGGDLKMLSATGAWIGAAGLAASILASFFFFTVIVLSHKTKEGPYGLSLFLGVIVVLVLQALPAFHGLFVF